MKQNRCYIFLVLATLFVGRLVYASDVEEQRVVNLVIANSSEEFFDGNIDERNVPIMQYLLMALAEQELVLCHKHLWGQVLKMVDYAKSQPWFVQWNQFEEQVFALSGDIRGGVDRLIHLHAGWLRRDECFGFESVVSFYACYQIFKAHAYECKDVGDYILFVPTSLADKGFRLNLPMFDINKEFAAPLRDESSDNLYKALVQMAQDEQVKNYAYTIFLIGHGTLGERVAEMSVQQNFGRPSSLSRFLTVLEQRFHVNSLTIVTCYGGANQQKVASYTQRPFVDDLSFPILLSGVDDVYLSPPLTITAEDFDSVDGWDCLYQVAPGKYLYGPSKKNDGNGFFELFFECMNRSAHYKVSQHSYKKTIGLSSPSYEYDVKKPEYIRAVYLLREGLQKKKSEGFSIRDLSSDPSNMFFVRYPHSSAWVPVEKIEEKGVFVVSKTKVAAADEEIRISKDVERVYLATFFVPVSLNLMDVKPGCRVLPIVFDKQLFFIKKLILPRSYSLEKLNNVFYMRPSQMKSDRKIFIEELVIGDNNIYNNVLLVHEFEPAFGFRPSPREVRRDVIYEEGGITKMYDFSTSAKKDIKDVDRESRINYHADKEYLLKGNEFQEMKANDYSQVKAFVSSPKGVGKAKDLKKQTANIEKIEEKVVEKSASNLVHPRAKEFALDALELASLLK